MDARTITKEHIRAFALKLEENERSEGTVQKYLRDVRAFAVWLGDKALSKQSAMEWKAELLRQDYSPNTVNSMLAALNGFFRFLGREDCRVQFLKIQRRLFRTAGRELTRAEYERLLEAARSLGRDRLALLIETICATGIRVSEVKYITVEAVKYEKAEISLKGKVRTILIPGKLGRKLLKYARKKNIVSGEIFLNRNGKGMSRKQIWAGMKALCKTAGVQPSKVFPHNLRHLFARVFYHACRDIAKLADVLGHSSVETTRIYLISTSETLARQLERLRLIS